MKPNNDKPPLSYNLERSLDPMGTKKASNFWGTVLLWFVYLYMGFIVLIVLNYVWMGYARAQRHRSQQPNVVVHQRAN